MPISDMPLVAAGEGTTLTEKVAAYIETARVRAADGITVAELVELILSAMRIAIDAVDALNVSGAEKKRIVTDLAAMLFDEFADLCVPALARPAWWLLRPAARSLCLAAAAGAVEALLPLIRGDR